MINSQLKNFKENYGMAGQSFNGKRKAFQSRLKVIDGDRSQASILKAQYGFSSNSWESAPKSIF